MKGLVSATFLAFAVYAVCADEELPRTWTSTSGKTLQATFWKVERGVVELQKSDKAITTINLESLIPEDITYIIRKGGGVWMPTAKRLAGNYVIDPKGKVVPRRPSDVRIEGTITAIIDKTMITVTNGESEFVILCNAESLKKGELYSCWGRAGESTMTLPNGTSAKVYAAYTALDDIEKTGRLIQKDPLAFANYFTGKSRACQAYENDRAVLEKVATAEERKTKNEQEKLVKREDARDARADERRKAKDAKLAESLKEKVKDYERQVTTLESNIRSWEAKKRRAKMHSKTYNSMRKKIGEAELRIRKLKTYIRDTNAELLKLEG